MIRKLVLAALAALPVMAIASVASAQIPETQSPDAATDHRLTDRDHVVGIVQEEQGQTLILRTRDGQVDVHWNANTVCKIDGEAADCERIEPGFGVLAVGEWAGESNQFQADSIRARSRTDRPDSDRPHVERLRGVVHSDEGQTLGVETRGGDYVLVLWSEETTCRTRDGEIRCEEIAVDDQIAAAGELSDGELTARQIVKLSAVDADRPHVGGLVTANHGSVIAIETRDGGSLNVHYDTETECKLGREQAIDCDAIEPGARIVAFGSELGGLNFDADRIFVLQRHDAPERDALQRDAAQRDVRPALTPSGASPPVNVLP